MSFEDWWKENEDRLYVLVDKEITKQAWQAAQEEFKKQLDDELTAAFMLGHNAAKNDHGRKE